MDQKKRARAEAWFRYADDLGLGPYYRDRAPQSSEQPRAKEGIVAAPPSGVGRLGASREISAAPIPAMQAATPKPAAPAKPNAQPAFAPAASAAAPAFVQRPAGTSLFESADRIEGDTLDRIRTDITPTCTRCKLHKARKQIVFGVGNPKAQLVFVGEGPGRDEDEQGEPFVGRAGKLLTQMIEAMSLKRDDVYICNVVKCRPPENRLPEKDEIATCSPYLYRQLGVINPKVICCLGACSAQTLLETTQGISRFRGEWFDYRGAKLIATYHPAYLLRNPAAKGEVWKDLQKVMAYLGLQPKRR
ncbi:MAG TPA: uracil-DNA glycosylase [Candidatus Acidoferrales bacterium]|jgi:DNA polymerase|nr:uracil-DNA glycosylase [Candidatus Acidoferrales bacterium]